MKKLLGYIFTPIYLIVFGLLLLVFHPLQVICLKLGGYHWHKKSVDYLNLSLMRSLVLIGAHCKWEKGPGLPQDRPLIVVSNHQGIFDIPPFFWHLRKHHMKFVSKIELAHGIPSISYNLRHGGSVVIDRKNPRQAIPALKEFGAYIEENNYATTIFPEGTRSKDGVPKRFSHNGLKTLLKYIPSAVVVPVTINNSWRLLQYGWYPMSFGEAPRWKVHPHIDPKGLPVDEVIDRTVSIITQAVDYQGKTETVGAEGSSA